MNFKETLVKAGKRMLQSGLTVETWGNISVRDPETRRVYLTPSGMDYNICTEKDIVVCDLDGNILDGNRKPTIEKKLHLQIYLNRPEINVVIHTHPIYSKVFACTKKDIPLFIDEAAQTLGDVVRVADYALPGFAELADNCVRALRGRANACLLQSHGAVCVGEDIKMAFKVVKVLEMTAKLYYLTKQIGEPILITDSHIEEMQTFVQNEYGQQ